MSPKHSVEKPRDVMKRLRAEGWTERAGKGDHVVFVKPGVGSVSVDTGAREIPVGTLRSIYKAAGWAW